ncbi:MAG: ATP-binding cassette domain-containing protein [Deltaproteobacteria bacterium]|nr:ATP-binding cassette domain-containing protein [Deltaproteobacteria bacterium]
MQIEAHINSISISDTIIKYGNLEIACSKGELVCFTSPNGAGKTLLLNCLSGIIPFINRLGKVKGTVWYDGKPIEQDSFNHFRKHIVFVSENPTSNILLSHVLDEVSIDLQLSGIERVQAKKTAHQALADMGLPTCFSYRNISQLSSGEAQKVILANALARKSSILFLDEPTQCLDGESRVIFFRNLDVLKNDAAIICASQDSEFINRADQVIPIKCKRSQVSSNTKHIGHRFYNSISGSVFIHRAHTKLEINNLVVGYRQSNWQLGPLNLSVESGTALWIKGGNGSGKTTLLATIARLIKPLSGRVTLNGCSPRDQMKRITFAQHPSALTFLFSSIAQELALLDGNDNCGRSAGQSARNMWAAFAAGGSLDVDPRQLSYGQQKILNILSRDPCVDLMLFDEPTVGLDAETRKSVSLLIKRLIETGRIVIFASHDTKFAKSTATRNINLEQFLPSRVTA